MRIFWRALLGYGFVFWIVLCITDFLGITDVHKRSNGNIEPYNVKHTPNYNQELSPEKYESFTFEYNGYKFSWPQLLWNTLTFVVSIVLCSIGRVMVLSSWEYYQKTRNQQLCNQIVPQRNTLQRSHSALSKIPIMVKTTASKNSDVTLKNENDSINEKQSCPNLLSKRTKSNLSTIEPKKLKTLYSNDSFNQPKDASLIEQLEKQIRHYKEEFIKLQSSSLKEHAALSRKLEQVYKERTDLFKQLTIAQKETRGAKRQLEELLQEKTDLLKKMDHATKELKANTKTKKVAFAKLEEVTSTIDELRAQLEQVSRDKEIMEKKLRLMEGEYNKLHERYIATQEKFYSSEIDENIPQRDKNITDEETSDQLLKSFEYCETTSGTTSNAMDSVSQTQLDMAKIQDKIKQLEKNLENLNYSTQNLAREELEVESELSLLAEASSESLEKDDSHFTPESGYSGNGSPRHGGLDWSSKVVELIGKNKNKFAQIQVLATKLREKTEILNKIRYESSQPGDSSEEELSSNDEVEPTRIVSNSLAFKNFLKGLNVTQESKTGSIKSTTEVLF